jgi:hypothetical protein
VLRQWKSSGAGSGRSPDRAILERQRTFWQLKTASENSEGFAADGPAGKYRVFTSDNGYFWRTRAGVERRLAYEVDPSAVTVRYPQIIKPGTVEMNLRSMIWR